MNTTDNNMSTDGNNKASTLSKCANCGKEGSNLNSCNRCKLVTYCNRACKKKHRSKHKKKCDRRVAEMHDDKLFKQPPQREECPICFLRLPSMMNTGSKYNTCCGKVICSGCVHAPVYDNNGNKVKMKCPFCRAATPTSDDEIIDLLKKRMEVGDTQAINILGYCYAEGIYGLPQDWNKGLELLHRAGELGNVHSYFNIGNAYYDGEGVERDEKKAIHYTELAAIGGDASARHNLGCSEANKRNYDRALKHFMIAVEGGYYESLKTIQQLYTNGRATRDDYAKALQAYQAYLVEIKSDDWDKAAAFSDNYKYY